jgi:hypothetical protein
MRGGGIGYGVDTEGGVVDQCSTGLASSLDRRFETFMGSSVGILMDGYALRKAIQGYQVHESINIYREIAIAEEIPIVVFSVNGINLRRNTVRGYIPTDDGWESATAPIPRVIHKRVLYSTSPPLNVLSRLRSRGVVFVNPYLMQNKYAIYQLLACDAQVAPHLPATWVYSWRRLVRCLAMGHTMILKPMIGSVGRGVMRIAPRGKYSVELAGKHTRMMSYSHLRRYLHQQVQPRRFLLQQYLNLAKVNDNPFDLRVPVQRDETGEWTVPGMVAKISGVHPFLTNLAQGGAAIPGEAAIAAAFSPSVAADVRISIEPLAKNVAKAIARAYPSAADLGLDIGLDVEAKPWLIEVNSRDQRITFSEAGLHDTHKTLYRNPLMYCARLIKERT